MSDIMSRLNDIWSDDDHERGCAGRTYSCSCGFDDRTFVTAKDATAIIQKLTEALEQMVDAVEKTECPYPLKEAGDELATSCVKAGLCGCVYGALPQAREALSLVRKP